MMAGKERQLASIRTALLLAACLCSGGIAAQALYKYQDESGAWVYTDRAPPKTEDVEVRNLPTGNSPTDLSVTARLVGRTVEVVAVNALPIKVDVRLDIDRLGNLAFPDPDIPLQWVVDAGASETLLALEAIDDNLGPALDFSYTWLPGDPNAVHQGNYRYRVPYAVATSHRVTQTYPVGITHLTPDSYYAVDFDMPVGTNVFAARDGVVFAVSRNNFVGGDDAEAYLDAANIVRIMHDDGSHAIYAHLNWNSIRVRTGDRVQRGQHIADSGNTGYSTGPHLHFAVLINEDSNAVSVPIGFAGAGPSLVNPATDAMLTAY